MNVLRTQILRLPKQPFASTAAEKITEKEWYVPFLTQRFARLLVQQRDGSNGVVTI